MSPFYGVYARSFTLIPEFEEKILEGEVHIRGRIRAATVLWTAGRVFLNKNFRRLLREEAGERSKKWQKISFLQRWTRF